MVESRKAVRERRENVEMAKDFGTRDVQRMHGETEDSRDEWRIWKAAEGSERSKQCAE
jgi:hypothetical protein